ncbi:hypothetical protein XELAEV_18030989mg [Xenopus laevis]|uniref:Uncharacterized protein n=1 Tax=Xenopus laevis TaxID=8355 RepID=A0A974CN99_XENLA|nr:hypothetical protein XELAEV_18030989mg [Xenopus laevis]
MYVKMTPTYSVSCSCSVFSGCYIILCALKSSYLQNHIIKDNVVFILPMFLESGTANMGSSVHHQPKQIL